MPSFVPRPSDSHSPFEFEAMLRLEAARLTINALLAGHWHPDDDTLAGLEELVSAARMRFRWASIAATVEGQAA